MFIKVNTIHEYFMLCLNEMYNFGENIQGLLSGF